MIHAPLCSVELVVIVSADLFGNDPAVPDTSSHPMVPLVFGVSYRQLILVATPNFLAVLSPAELVVAGLEIRSFGPLTLLQRPRVL